jgi:hypothetical protein
MSTFSSSFSLTKRKKVNKLFTRLQHKLSPNLKNKGNFLLSTDILRDDIKRDLLRIVVLNIETKFLNLIKRDLNLFDDKAILLELVKLSTEDFFNQLLWFQSNYSLYNCFTFCLLPVLSGKFEHSIKSSFLGVIKLKYKSFSEYF